MVFGTTNGIEIGGRFRDQGYNPLGYGSQNQGVRLFLGTVHIPGHPVMAGVSSFDGGSSSYHGTGGLGSGATLIADWTNGAPLVAEKGRVIGLNFFAPSSDARSDFWEATTQGGLLMGNAMNVVCVPEPASFLALGAGLAFFLRKRKKA